jgi:hypothetical protein
MNETCLLYHKEKEKNTFPAVQMKQPRYLRGGSRHIPSEAWSKLLMHQLKVMPLVISWNK